jgi:hypothetical protein
MKKIFSLLLLTLALAACSAQEPFPPEPSILPEAHEGQEVENKSPTAFAPILGQPTLADYYKILVAGEPSYNFLKDAAVTPDEPAERYLTAISKDMTAGSSFTFAMFPGDGKDLVVVQKKRCGQGCSYSYAAYSFTANDYKFLLFSSLLPKDDIEATAQRAVPQGKVKNRKKRGRGGMIVQGWPRAEHMRIQIPSKKDAIPFYVLREISSRKKEDVNYYDLGSLTWNRGDFKFDFHAHGKAKSLGKLDY